jgi:tetratricopeptide (TPR) repeat protein
MRKANDIFAFRKIMRGLPVSMLIACIAIGWSAAAHAQDVDKSLLNKGLQAYANADYELSAEAFAAALNRAPDHPLLNFNYGAALYKQGDIAGAQKAFEAALAADDPTLKRDAYYNLGNALFLAEKYQEAIEAYKEALKLSPEDRESKYNLELAQRKLKAKQQEQQQQNQEQQPPIEPSEFAKQLKAQAEILVSQKLYKAAYDLMMRGLRSDETVAAYQTFINRLKEVAEIDQQGAPK